ncbi:5-formyltetrahydrofolate cyclo-ligase [Marinobacter halodurans]|uniref:5-formyltetrahydrofolate cyclo-ligase n=1 Tax=Marinobacter halodurans TaxID=2528979 RepID=A0ABY1ZTC3_9GAMM|nr:5-formyltetrahydrofolate cyclo-ligase [Marinobacter halodurans]
MTAFLPPLPASPDRKRLRRQLRQRRRSLSPAAQRKASRALVRQLMRYFSQSRARHIGLYLPNDGEIDPRAFIIEARRRRQTVYLPVLHPILGNRLWFYRLDPTTRLKPNRFGIPEPAARNAPRRAPWALDAVLMPLVGFDRQGGRLGMGGGFYDRTFAFKRREAARPPALIGLAHDSQQVEKLPVESWDVPMDAVITPARQVACDVGGIRERQEPGRLFIGHFRLGEKRQGRLRRRTLN